MNPTGTSVRPQYVGCCAPAFRRIPEIACTRLWLDGAAPEATPVSAIRRGVPWAVAAACALAAGIALWAPWRMAAPAYESIRTQVQLPENVNSAGKNFTVYPDGRK